MSFLILALQFKQLCFYCSCFVVDTSVKFEENVLKWARAGGELETIKKKKRKPPQVLLYILW